MKIAHISDVHIRNTKYHEDYTNVFNNLYKKLEELQPDIIVNTGDTGHSKTQISPEFVQMCSTHIRNTVSIAPYWILLGNHDMNLMNLDRQDAITPIVESIDDKNVHLLKNSGVYNVKDNFNFWAFSLADQKNYPKKEDWENYNDCINVGLFHGSIRSCLTDSNWRMTNTEQDLSIFDGLDYVLMGDIHKQQYFNNKRIAYAGSLIQQNFGEDLNKGFLFWNIKDKENFSVEFYKLDGSRGFYTLKLDENLKVIEEYVNIKKNSRLRIIPPRNLNVVEHKDIESNIKKKYSPHDVIILSPSNISTNKTQVGKKKLNSESLRITEVQERFIRDYFKNRELSELKLHDIFELNKKYQITANKEDDVQRDVKWKFDNVVWSNLFNYGDNNFINFNSIGGITGIFAPNGSGKSNLIDILLETLFDKTTKGITKNIFLINDNKDSASSLATITTNDDKFLIERHIEKIKFGQRKLENVKEWGKTSVNFFSINDGNKKEDCNGDTRPETERNIRQKVGTYDDFLLTSLCAQWNPEDVISCKETERKKILYKFMDLDIFEQKCLLAKEDFKQYYNKLKLYDEDKILKEIKEIEKTLFVHSSSIETERLIVTQSQQMLANSEKELSLLLSKKKNISKVHIDIDSITKNIQNNKEQYDSLNNELVKFEEEIKQLKQSKKLLKQSIDIDILLKNLSINERGIKLLEGEIKELENKIANNKKNLLILDNVPCGDNYPSCKFLIGAFESKKDIPALQNTLYEKLKLRPTLILCNDELTGQIKQFNTKISVENSIERVSLKIENILLKIKENKKENKNLNKLVEDYNQHKEDIIFNNDVDDKICEVNNDISSLKFVINNKNKIIEELSKKLGAEQRYLEINKSQIEEIKEIKKQCEAYENYIEAMGKDGIPFYILTEKLPVINEEINKVLSSVCDFNVNIQFDNEEQSIKIYIQYGQYKSRLIELGGGAEKMIASIAIRIALLRISNLPKTSLFIIDEGFGKLDEKNLEAIQRMIDYLRDMFDNVIIISHILTMKDIVDNIIDITSDDEGYAHIEVGEKI